MVWTGVWAACLLENERSAKVCEEKNESDGDCQKYGKMPYY